MKASKHNICTKTEDKTDDNVFALDMYNDNNGAYRKKN